MISIYHFYNIRSKIFSLIIIFLSLVSCNGQETISVKISNRSTIIIDSISLYNKKIKCKIRPKSDTIIDVDIKNIDTYNEEIVGMNLYQNGKQKNATIGFHDMGQISKFDIYVFNEGVFNTDKPIIPNEFYIYFSVAKNQSIDTIFKKKSMISIYEESPGVMRLKFDFSKFKENPKFEAIVSGKKQEFKFDFHDFNDWNSTNEQVTVRKNGKIEYSQNDAVIPEQIYNDEFKVYFTILIENKDSEVKFTDEDFLCSCNCIEKIYTTNAAYRLLLDKEKLKNKSILTLKTNESVYNYVIKKADLDESGNSLSLIFENKKLYNIIDR